MPRHCTVCDHPQREAVDAALLARTSGYRRIATRFGLDECAVRRHAQMHLAAQLAASEGARILASNESLVAEMNEIHRVVHEAMDRAMKPGDLRTALVAAEVARRNVETLERLGVVYEQRQQMADAVAEASALLDEPFTWDVTVRCQDGKPRTVTVEWQPWMGPRAAVQSLLDTLGEAEVGLPTRSGKSVEQLRAEVERMMRRGPDGDRWLQRLADAAQVTDQ